MRLSDLPRTITPSKHTHHFHEPGFLGISQLRDTNSSIHNLIGTFLNAESLHLHFSTVCDTNSSFLVAPCGCDTTPPFFALLVHPSKLHCLCLVPCLMHTPPLNVSMKVHCFTVAPCVTQTPPLVTASWFVHPLWLHCLYVTLAPCVIQTPLFWAYVVQPLWLHLFLVLILAFTPC